MGAKHETTKAMVWLAIKELRAGDQAEAIDILEKAINPKWRDMDHCGSHLQRLRLGLQRTGPGLSA